MASGLLLDRAASCRASGVRREDIFVTTKVYHDKLAPVDFQRSLDQSLEKLKLAFVDLCHSQFNAKALPQSEGFCVSGARCRRRPARLKWIPRSFERWGHTRSHPEHGS